MFRSYSDFQFENYPDILYASKITIAEGSTCFRIVIRKINEQEYVTHMENVVLDGNTWKHGDFAHGHYFHAKVPGDANAQRVARDAALKDFNERCAKL